MIIRARTEADRTGCHEVFFRAVREGAKDHYSEAHRKAWAREEKPDLSQPDRFAGKPGWVAVEDGQIAGFLIMGEGDYLDMLFVLPERMGTGVAGALYDHMLGWARGNAFERLKTHASHLARPFFARRGWSVLEREFHPAHGLEFERFHMALPLGEDDG